MERFGVSQEPQRKCEFPGNIRQRSCVYENIGERRHSKRILLNDKISTFGETLEFPAVIIDLSFPCGIPEIEMEHRSYALKGIGK